MSHRKIYTIRDRLKFIDTITNPKSIENMLETEDIQRKIHNFRKLILQIGGKLSYVKSGSTGHTFKGTIKKDDDKIHYAVKIVAITKKGKYGMPDNEKRPENAELKMIKVLSKLVIEKKTPHVVLPIYCFNTELKSVIDILTKKQFIHNKKYQDKFDDFVERYQKGGYHEMASVLISEWADGGDFLDFLRKSKDKKTFEKMNANHWRCFFFQIISTLASILEQYPSFRHNDLKPNNILVQKTKKSEKNDCYTYKINDKLYKIPNIGYQLKLWDFDFACIPGIVENSKVDAKWTNKINVTPARNQYYDIHYFFNILTKKGFLPEIMTSTYVPQEVKDFINRIVPDKLKKGKHIHKRGRILIDQEFKTPVSIIENDPFFSPYRYKIVSKK